MIHSCGRAHCHAHITNAEPHTFSLALGGIEIIRLYDTTLLGETAQSWLPDFDRERVAEHEHWLAPTHYDPESGRIPMPVHSWIVRTGRHTVLIDSCIGNHKDRPGLPEMHRLSTRYLDRMRSLGIQPEEIDYVMCSHLHADHVGWNTQLVNGAWVPTFPNARYVISQVEHDHLVRAIRGEGPTGPAWFKPMYNDSVLPVIEAGQATMFDDIYELDDTFLIRHAPGHSPGHVRIELSSGGARGVFSGDMLHSPIQIPFWEWSSKVCDDRALAAKSRFELLAHCAEHGALLLPGHFEAPHAGHIVDASGRFAIEFLE